MSRPAGSRDAGLILLTESLLLRPRRGGLKVRSQLFWARPRLRLVLAQNSPTDIPNRRKSGHF